MTLLPILVAGALLVLAVAFGLHCFVLHCDKPRPAEAKRSPPADSRSPHTSPLR